MPELHIAAGRRTMIERHGNEAVITEPHGYGYIVVRIPIARLIEDLELIDGMAPEPEPASAPEAPEVEDVSEETS